MARSCCFLWEPPQSISAACISTTLSTRNSIFNIASYQNPAMDKQIDAARFAPDQAAYDNNVRGFLTTGMTEVPMVPICQPFHDVAMQKSIGGYQFWPCREPDFRYLTKA